MGKSSYELCKEFKDKYPGTVTWRLKKHCDIIDKHLNGNEKLLYVFAGQLDNNIWSFFNTGVVAITSERLIFAQNRIIFGYKFASVTPDLYNDFEVDSRIIWGRVTIDTLNEQIYISNLSKKSLPEIETKVTMFMQEAKKKYPDRDEFCKGYKD